MKYNVVLIVGPAGSGKDFFTKSLCNFYETKIKRVVTATTRPKRNYEQHGRDYYFMTIGEFSNSKMLESTNFNGWWYGTPLKSLSSTKTNIAIVNPSGIEAYLNCKDINVQAIIYLCVEDKIRLIRQLEREEEPNCGEIMRRYNADTQDFKNINEKYPLIILPNNSMEDMMTNIKLFQDILN